VATSLPRQFVVPAHVTDDKLAGVAGLGLGTRPPVWVWGTKAGGHLYLQPQMNVATSEEVRQQYGQYYHPPGAATRQRDTIDLDLALPNSLQLEEAYLGMLDLHCLETEREVEEREARYLSSLEATGWMAAVGTVLRTSRDVAERVQQGRLVVLVEGEGRTLCPLVASLAMLLLSDHYRTREGWQQLVQANWVCLGFPFSRHHTLSSPSTKPALLNPTFLLFLDCTHQLCQQFPATMAFLPAFLVQVWDSALSPTFHTFLYDCQHDREVGAQGGAAPARYSAWAWEVQFTPEQVASWDNPLYPPLPFRPPRRRAQEPSELSMLMERPTPPSLPETKKLLHPSGALVNLEVWHQLFHRGVPFLQLDPSPADSLYSVRKECKEQVEQLSTSTVQGPNNRS